MRTKQASYLVQVASALESFGQTIRGKLDKGNLDTDEQIQLGTRLLILTKMSNILLDIFKTRLRETAVQQDSQPGTQHFNATDGSRCAVTIPKSSLAVRKNVDISELKPVLGTTLFDSLFETSVVYKPRKEFRTRVASCAPDLIQAALGVVEIREGTPRVSFKG